MQHVHDEIQLRILFQDGDGMFEQHFAGVRQDDFVAHAFDEPRLVLVFQFLHMFGDGRLRDVQFLRRLRIAKCLSHAAEYVQSEIGHAVIHFRKILTSKNTSSRCLVQENDVKYGKMKFKTQLTI